MKDIQSRVHTLSMIKKSLEAEVSHYGGYHRLCGAHKKALEQVDIELLLLKTEANIAYGPISNQEKEEYADKVVKEIVAEDKAISLIKKFIEDHKISCAEMVFDSDKIAENATSLICDLCDLIGYYQYPEEE